MMKTEIDPVHRLSRRTQWSGGQPISDLMARALANPELISLAAGFVDQQTLPTEETRQAVNAIFADQTAGQAALQYGSTPGYPPLRDALLAQQRQYDGQEYADLDLDQVVVTAGSNQLLHLVADTLLDPQDIVLCSAPTYFVFMGSINSVGGCSVAVPTDEHGMIPEGLEETFQRLDAEGELHRIKAIYLVSYFDNPRGVTTSLQRRQEIVELAKRWSLRNKIYVLEDAAYRELRYHGDDLPSARSFDEEGDTVVVAGTFSKSYSPGIRVGWGLLPRPLVQPVCDLKGNIDFGSPHFSQCLMAKVLELSLFEDHVQRLRQGYQEKMEAMLSAADEFLGPIDGVSWYSPGGGLYVWLTLPGGVETGSSGTLFDAAVDHGVLYVPGQFCYPTQGQPVQKNTIRLSFGVQSIDRIREGVRKLASAINEVV